MQVQISQRIAQDFDAPPINLYRALRSINPSPYMFYFDLGEFQIVGASPEILVRQEGSKVTVRPIAGTRKRGDTPERDRALEAELRADPKEQAEHLMLIDLGRNDIGRIAKTGSVKVTEQMVVERYSHVMHLVSNVEGEIQDAGDNIGPIELLRATFPAGTVTGTPKVRAMEIIDELEVAKRGVYAGAAGYLGFNGNMDLAISIRAGVVRTRNSTCRLRRASWPIRWPNSNGRKPKTRHAPCCAPPKWSPPASTPTRREENTVLLMIDN